MMGKELGFWSEESHTAGMFLIQPGLYFGSSGKRAKTRGVPLAAIQSLEEQFRTSFSALATSGRLERGDVHVPQKTFFGLRVAVHRHRTDLLGQWTEIVDSETGEIGKVIKFDWTTKRAASPVLAPLPGIRDWLQTFPQEGDPNAVTTPYSKDIGGLIRRDLERLILADQPDWTSLFQPSEIGL
jgi:hypothetical protein